MDNDRLPVLDDEPDVTRLVRWVAERAPAMPRAATMTKPLDVTALGEALRSRIGAIGPA